MILAYYHYFHSLLITPANPSHPKHSFTNSNQTIKKARLLPAGPERRESQVSYQNATYLVSNGTIGIY